jgi:uncharacterized membrane protein YphA (DoxX/SURF4 family)
MRVVVGAMATAQGFICISNDGSRMGELFACLALAASGACLLIGFLTPLASIVITIAVLANGLSWLPVAAGHVFGGNVASFELIVMAIALTLLGPGGFSLDARLLGRHEIVIPPASRAPRS